MLYITFKKTEEVLIYVNNYFDVNYDEEWFQDAFVKDMMRDVCDATVLPCGVIDIKDYGKVAPTQLSVGVKALILMLKTDRVVYATVCGDNCAKWIIEIAKKKDVTICLQHYMEFEEDFIAVCLDNNKEIHGVDDYRRCADECLVY